jgi:hypothetical protein
MRAAREGSVRGHGGRHGKGQYGSSHGSKRREGLSSRVRVSTRIDRDRDYGSLVRKTRPAAAKEHSDSDDHRSSR